MEKYIGHNNKVIYIYSTCLLDQLFTTTQTPRPKLIIQLNVKRGTSKERCDNDEEFRNKVKAAAVRRYYEKKEKTRLAKLELQ